MRTSIKQKLHDLIDQIENEQFLKQVYKLINSKSPVTNGKLWVQLTSDQQNEILLSLEESNDPKNLISNDEVKSNHKKWL